MTEQMTVVLGSKSELKIRALNEALERLGIEANIISRNANSSIGNQPVGRVQTRIGARERVNHAKSLHPGADLYIGIENGMCPNNMDWFDVACVYILADDDKKSIVFSAEFPIPKWMAERTIEQKSELGEIIKKLAGGGEKDPMSYLSENSVSRQEILANAIQCAIAPIIFPSRYEE